jgi:hypothetical protein
VSQLVSGDSASAHALAGSADLRRAFLVSAGVGTALVLLNQGDLLLGAIAGAPLPTILAWKIPLTYLVPFLVSYLSSRTASRAASRRTVATPE